MARRMRHNRSRFALTAKSSWLLLAIAGVIMVLGLLPLLLICLTMLLTGRDFAPG